MRLIVARGLDDASIVGAMRQIARWVLVLALCSCGRSGTKATVDASDAIVPRGDLPQESGMPVGTTDVPAVKAPAPDLAELPPDTAPDGSSGPTDTPAGPDSSWQEVAGHADGKTDAQAASGDATYLPGLDGGGCSSLDECACYKTAGCAAVAEDCWCPAACGVKCFCGGGRFFGCVPLDLAKCTGAADRVTALCPSLAADVRTLCPASDDACSTKCLNDVTLCDDLLCSTCQDCKCKQDKFGSCLEVCLAGKTN
jgi:hypothetical protein